MHILNADMQMPFLSDQEIEQSPEIDTYISNHISKYIQNDAMNTCYFTEDEHPVYEALRNIAEDEANFITATKTMAYELYSLMLQHVSIPSADVIFATFDFDGIPYMALLKLNYKPSYIHLIEEDDDHTTQANHIIKQTALPTDSQKLDEVILFNLSNFEIRLLEKRYEINGEKDFYLSKYYLKSSPRKSNKEKFNIVHQTLNAMNKKYFDEDVNQSMNVKKAMLESVEEKGVIDIGHVIEQAFEDKIELQEEFKEKIQKKGIDEPYISFESALPKKIEKQVIKTDSGIEINIPMDQYGNDDVLEFQQNPDGTLAITIKNIQKITGR